MSFDITQGAQSILRHLNRTTAIDWQAQTLDSTPGLRMVVQYELYDRGSQATPRAPFLAPIGKFYADTTGEHTFQIMRELSAQLAQLPEPLLALPHALLYDSQQGLLVQQRVDGTPFYDLLKQARFHHSFQLAGQALAQLHGLPIAGGRHTQLADHLRELIRPHPMELAEHMPAHHTQITALLQCFAEQERSWHSSVRAAPIHRDLHLRQLFHGQGRIWLIDWDLFAYGDPALDIGNFLVYLETHTGAQSAAASEAFLAGYCASQQEHVLSRVPVYMAFTFMRLACKRYRLKGPDWEDRVQALLRRSEECLNQRIGVIV